jgi:ClpP class serine protease
MILPAIFNEITTSVWMFSEQSAKGQMLLLASLLNGKLDENKIDYSEERKKSALRLVTFDAAGIHHVSEYGEYSSPENAPENSISLIEINGAITKNDQYCGPSGTKTKANLLMRADQTDNIQAHILYIDSGGGSGNAALEFSRMIRDDIQKPVFAFIDDLGASAAYWIAASCDYVYANSTFAQAGSIGTYISIADLEEYWKNEGIKWIDIYAKQSKDKNKPYLDALNGDTKLLEEDATKFNANFIGSIKKLRKGKLNFEAGSDEDPFTGKLFNADIAESIGLVDEIATFNKMVQDINNYIKSN